MSFCTLFWDDITIIWDKILFSFLTEKKNLFWTNKKFVYILNFHQQNYDDTNQKYSTKGHEQVYCFRL